VYPPIAARSDTSGFLRNSRSWSRPMQPFSISAAVPGSPHNAPDSQLTHSGNDRGEARRSVFSCCSGAHLVQEIGTTQVHDVRTSATLGAAKALALPARHRLLAQNQRYDNSVNSLQTLSQCRSWQEPCGFSAMFPNRSREYPTNSSGMPSTRRAQDILRGYSELVRSRGSRASRTASPARLMHSTRIPSAIPGNRIVHGAISM